MKYSLAIYSGIAEKGNVIKTDMSVEEFEKFGQNKELLKKEDNSIVGFYWVNETTGVAWCLVPNTYNVGDIVEFHHGGKVEVEKKNKETGKGENAKVWGLEVQKEPNGQWEQVNSEPLTKIEAEAMKADYEKSGKKYHDLKVDVPLFDNGGRVDSEELEKIKLLQNIKSAKQYTTEDENIVLGFESALKKGKGKHKTHPVIYFSQFSEKENAFCVYKGILHEGKIINSEKASGYLKDEVAALGIANELASAKKLKKGGSTRMTTEQQIAKDKKYRKFEFTTDKGRTSTKREKFFFINKEQDEKRPAKPTGFRWFDGRGVPKSKRFERPTIAEIKKEMAKPDDKRKIYFEDRRHHSDLKVSKKIKLVKGGEIGRYTKTKDGAFKVGSNVWGMLHGEIKEFKVIDHTPSPVVGSDEYRHDYVVVPVDNPTTKGGNPFRIPFHQDYLASTKKEYQEMFNERFNFCCGGEMKKGGTLTTDVYDLRISLGSGLSKTDAVDEKLRDLFLENNGAVSKAKLDRTIESLSNNYPFYMKAWKEYRRDNEIETEGDKYINPFVFVYENGGSISTPIRFTENDFRRLTDDDVVDFSGTLDGDYWSIYYHDKKEKTTMLVGKFYPDKEKIITVGSKKLKNPLVLWLQQNSYVSNDEYWRLSKGGSANTIGIDWQSSFSLKDKDIIRENVMSHVADMIEQGFEEGKLLGEEPDYNGWFTVKIEKDDNEEEVRNNEVAKNIRNGNSSGYYPTYTFSAKIWNETKELSKGGSAKRLPEKGTPDWHQLQIAKKTINMTPAMANIMGGMSVDEAKVILDKYGIKYNNSGDIFKYEIDKTEKNTWEYKIDGIWGGLSVYVIGSFLTGIEKRYIKIAIDNIKAQQLKTYEVDYEKQLSDAIKKEYAELIDNYNSGKNFEEPVSNVFPVKIIIQKKEFSDGGSVKNKYTIDELRDILGHEPNYPYQEINGQKYEKRLFKKYYEIVY